jgi:2-C-methyl-D-erythritol 4-phosphate cytidylyltransferase/2-C-methyl-D-erythritol 4-phosphate cytidylyltransferase/2-C-methyl-D-erythritol 2,4-cyclodiphosphate synthase
MEDLPDAAAVICAAGASLRMGGVKKEYRKLKNHGESLTVLGAAYSAFAKVPSIRVIVIAINENTEAAAREALPKGCLSLQRPKVLFVTGGNSRCASVYNALSVLREYNPNYVLIHDGARPWVSPLLIENILRVSQKFNAAIPLLPITETPKETDAPLPETGTLEPVFITRHLKRVNTGAAQTPQGFKFPEILYAHEKAALITDEEFTDDAEIWGRFCGTVAAIPGEPENKKITFAEDLYGD